MTPDVIPNKREESLSGATIINRALSVDVGESEFFHVEEPSVGELEFGNNRKG